MLASLVAARIRALLQERMDHTAPSYLASLLICTHQTIAGSDAFEGYVGVLQMAQSVTLAAEGGQMPSQQEMQAKLAAFQQVQWVGSARWVERGGLCGWLS